MSNHNISIDNTVKVWGVDGKTRQGGIIGVLRLVVSKSYLPFVVQRWILGNLGLAAIKRGLVPEITVVMVMSVRIGVLVWDLGQLLNRIIWIGRSTDCRKFSSHSRTRCLVRELWSRSSKVNIFIVPVKTLWKERSRIGLRQVNVIMLEWRAVR